MLSPIRGCLPLLELGCPNNLGAALGWLGLGNLGLMARADSLQLPGVRIINRRLVVIILQLNVGLPAHFRL